MLKILAPINNPKEIKEVISAGADEIYCGLMPYDWKMRYTNVASPNRREWTTANLSTYEELMKAVEVANSFSVPIFFTLNALYTELQYPMILKQAERAIAIGVSAFIVADLGMFLTLRREFPEVALHVSTGGTTFNSETALFYKELGAKRIILPRHMRVEEIRGLVSSVDRVEFEVFILNSGCKNIDGFCTFQHGVNEILHPRLWNLPKALNFDRRILNAAKRLPERINSQLKSCIFGVDSACLLNYKVSPISKIGQAKGSEAKLLKRRIEASFNLLSGADTCGGCNLNDFNAMGIYSIKIVGRNYSTEKKIKDVKFLKGILSFLGQGGAGGLEFEDYVKKRYREIYKLDCQGACYYPT